MEVQEWQVGDGATVCYYSDRHSYTVVRVTPSRIYLQRDKATRTDENGMRESQQYQYEADDDGYVFIASKRKDGRYMLTGHNTTGRVVAGRHEYYDYSF